MQGVPESQRVLRDNDGPEQHGDIKTVLDVGEASFKVQEIVHRVRVSNRSESKPQIVQAQRQQAPATDSSFHAPAAQGHDLHARGQQDELGRWTDQLREDAHAGADAEDASVLQKQAFR